MSKIEFVGLSRAFRGVVAVNNVNFTVEDGEFCVLLGPSGCGKSTLLRMLAGLLEPTSGRILVDGADVVGVPPKKRDLALVFQSYALYPHLNVERNLSFPLHVMRIGKEESRDRVNRVAAMLGLSELLTRKPRELSGGQRQRVALGRALVREPRAYLMDEPLSNLDAKLRTATRQELTEIHTRLGATFIYVTHDQVEAMTMATKIVVMNEGRVEQVGTPTELYDTPTSVFVASFLGSAPINLFDASVSATDGSVTLTSSEIHANLWPGHCEERSIVVGIRPEHLLVNPKHADIEFSGTVRLVENLGNENQIYVETGSSRLIVRTTRDVEVHTRQTIRLGVFIRHLHLFDQSTGRRMTWVDEPALSTSSPASTH